MKICKYKKHHHHKNLKLIVKNIFTTFEAYFLLLMILSKQSNLIIFTTKPTKNLIFYEIIQFKKDHYKKYCFHENNRKSFNLELNDILMVTNHKVNEF